MNQEQLEELRKMSSGQVARKYTPLLMRGQITREQFDWLVNQGLKEPPEALNDPEASVDVIEAFTTTHEDQEAGRSQKERLLSLLSDGLWHDTTEILRRVYGGDHLGLARAGARIYDLKQDGREIESRKKSGTVWEYRIVRG